jgi:hypothetical protein
MLKNTLLCEQSRRMSRKNSFADSGRAPFGSALADAPDAVRVAAHSP